MSGKILRNAQRLEFSGQAVREAWSDPLQ